MAKMTGQARIRYATAADIPSLVRLINAAYRVEDFFIDGDRTSAEDLESRLAAPGSCFIVAEDPASEEIAAAVWVKVAEKRGYFGMLSVDPAYQCEGLGRLLITEIERHCIAAGCHALDLDVVNLRLELPPFYEKLGFATCGTAPFNPLKKLRREAHMILMTKPLVAESKNESAVTSS
jgi:ribosomal protein S18 acetylase RimI-like enzyme